MEPNRFILEAKYLDKLKRVRKDTIVGVYRDLETTEKVKRKITSEESKYRVTFSIKPYLDPFML